MGFEEVLGFEVSAYLDCQDWLSSVRAQFSSRAALA